jgi:hypothetical protein
MNPLVNYLKQRIWRGRGTNRKQEMGKSGDEKQE